MEKYGVDTSPSPGKVASDQAPSECPRCKVRLVAGSNVPKCPRCGTAPFEVEPDPP